MIIGVPKEIKNNENRVAITPAGTTQFVKNGHQVIIEKNAGLGSGYTDKEFIRAGAIIEAEPSKVWNHSNMILKVKEPLKEEYKYFREDLILFAYLHLAAEPDLSKELIDSGITALAYETVEEKGKLPLLTPMSEIAGRMAAQLGAQYLEKTKGGKGILLSGVPGVPRGKVTIIGGGVVGTNAAKIAIGLGADVTIIDLNPNRLRELDDLFGSEINTLMSNPYNIEQAVVESDLVIGSVLIPGRKAPKLVTEDMVKSMSSGSVIVDVAIDQGGNFETINKPTTHDQPTHVIHDIVHYAVANIPGSVPRTATIALTNSTIPYALQIANNGLNKALQNQRSLKAGVNVAKGKVLNKAVADELGFALAKN
ncbi:alanine dehydrogenase [Oceanobacillus halophilus]|uniref:Alanine dehydrogenase n=1 Tax=Oceanobacillus halophilus TaxID=930130 RepID=A0A494ZVD8_9BACI|nr:alanine dehydrogenase [Oceanobacillus halophilus]RKQ30495.1 alanine dehydrogenase [Oceanobacillus halophilus]